MSEVVHVDENIDAIVEFLTSQGMDESSAQAVANRGAWRAIHGDEFISYLRVELDHWSAAQRERQQAENRTSVDDNATQPNSQAGVEKVLTIAKALGFYNGDPSTLNVGDAERDAIREYQTRRNLSPTGAIDSLTAADVDAFGRYLATPHAPATTEHAPAGPPPASIALPAPGPTPAPAAAPAATPATPATPAVGAGQPSAPAAASAPQPASPATPTGVSDVNPDGLNVVPGGGQLWQVGGDWFVVYMIPGTQTPMAWKVDDVAAVAGPGVYPTATRSFANEQEFLATGALNFGNSRELANMSEHPFDGYVELFGKQAEIQPWLRDPEIAALSAMAVLEGRTMSDAEFQTTEWYRTHNAQERAWVLASSADPASAKVTVDDNRRLWRDRMVAAGISDPHDTLVNWIADRVTAGTWSDSKAQSQIIGIANPQAGVEIDDSLDQLLSYVEGRFGTLKTTAGDIRGVRAKIETWLGPALAKGWSDAEVERWAGKIAADPNAEIELEQTLKGQRLAAFPEYEDDRLTYESIAGVWRGVWQNAWGEAPDETDPLFTEIMRTNDRSAAEQTLRAEGIRRGNGMVVDRALADTMAAFGGGVRRAQ